MTSAHTRAEIDRVRRDYPELWHFMETSCNSQCFGVLYDENAGISEAAREHARLNDEFNSRHLTRRLLDEMHRARTDDALNAIMCDGLASAWGGMGVLDKGWANMIAALEAHLGDTGITANGSGSRTS